VGFYVRGANMVVAITREGTRLRIQPPGYPPEDLVPDSYMNFVSALPPLPITFIQDAQGETTGFLLQYGAFSIPHTRIDASVARKILANNDARYRSQTPAPGTAAMMRRVIDGLHADKPNYEEMVPWFAELARRAQGLSFNKPYVQMGAVQSIEFRGVEFGGGDVYEVRQEGGTSTWVIWLDSNGLIEDALNWVW